MFPLVVCNKFPNCLHWRGEVRDSCSQDRPQRAKGTLGRRYDAGGARFENDNLPVAWRARTRPRQPHACDGLARVLKVRLPDLLDVEPEDKTYQPLQERLSRNAVAGRDVLWFDDSARS